MESFFIAETLKYLYLLFDEDHWLHQSEPLAEKLRVDGKGVCLFHKCKAKIDVLFSENKYLASWVFNTEAHPIDPSALECCHESEEDRELEQWVNDLDLNNLLEINTSSKTNQAPFSSKYVDSDGQLKCQRTPFYLKLSAWGDVFTKL